MRLLMLKLSVLGCGCCWDNDDFRHFYYDSSQCHYHGNTASHLLDDPYYVSSCQNQSPRHPYSIHCHHDNLYYYHHRFHQCNRDYRHNWMVQIMVMMYCYYIVFVYVTSVFDSSLPFSPYDSYDFVVRYVRDFTNWPRRWE